MPFDVEPRIARTPGDRLFDGADLLIRWRERQRDHIARAGGPLRGRRQLFAAAKALGDFRRGLFEHARFIAGSVRGGVDLRMSSPLSAIGSRMI